MTQRIIRNSVRCRRCGDEIVSRHRHDFRWCSCGAVAVDGGTAYLKRVGEPGLVEDTSIVEDDDTYDPSAIEPLRGMQPHTDRTPEQLKWPTISCAERMTRMNRRVRIISVPGIMSGDPCIEGTRVLAENVAIEMIVGSSLEQIAETYPTLPPGAVEAVMRWHFERTGDDLSTTYAARELREKGIEMMRRRAARADPAAVTRLLDEFGNEPPEPGDEIDE
jgi:uncharacterized protein (DUF433 family)